MPVYTNPVTGQSMSVGSGKQAPKGYVYNIGKNFGTSGGGISGFGKSPGEIAFEEREKQKRAEDQARIEAQQKASEDQARREIAQQEATEQRKIAERRALEVRSERRDGFISAYKGDKFNPLDTSSARKISGSAFVTYVKEKFASPTKKYDEKTYPSFKDIFSSYDFTGDLISEEKAYSYIPSGTVSTFDAGTKVVTKGDVSMNIEAQRDYLINREINKAQKDYEKYNQQLQEDIDKGGLGYEEAVGYSETKKVELTKQLQPKAEDIYKKYPEPYADLNKRTGSRVAGRAEFVKDIALMSTPIGSVIGAGISSMEDPIKVDIAQIERGVSIEGASTSRPSARTTIFLGAAALGAYGLVAKSGAEATATGIEDAIKAQSKLGMGTRVEKGRGFVETQKFAGKAGDFSAQSFVKTEGKLVGSDSFILSGKQYTEVFGREYFSQKPFVKSILKEVASPPISLKKLDYGIKFGKLGKLTALGDDFYLGEVELGQKTKAQSLLTIGKKGKGTYKFDYFIGNEFKDFEKVASVGRRVKVDRGVKISEQGDEIFVDLGEEFIQSVGGRVGKVEAVGAKFSSYDFMNTKWLSRSDSFLKKVNVLKKIETTIPETSESLVKVFKIPSESTKGFSVISKGGTKTISKSVSEIPSFSKQIIEKTFPSTVKKFTKTTTSFTPTSNLLSESAILAQASISLEKPTKLKQKVQPSYTSQLQRPKQTPSTKGSRIRSMLDEKQLIKTASLQIPKSITLERTTQKGIQKLRTGQLLGLSEKQITKQALKPLGLQPNLTPSLRGGVPSDFGFPIGGFPPFRFLSGSQPYKLPKGRGRSDDYLFLTEDFTGRAAGIKPQKIKEKDLLRIASDISLGLKIRGAPIVIPSLKRMMKKKRKKKK